MCGFAGLSYFYGVVDEIELLPWMYVAAVSRTESLWFMR